MRDLSYAEVKKWLISHEDGKLITTVNDGLGLLAILTILGLGATPALIGFTADLLAIKTELSTLAMRVMSWLGRNRELLPSDRIQRMRVAYGLITCSGFFEAVERRMPGAMSAFRLEKEDKTRLVQAALALKGKQREDIADLSGDLWDQPLLPFPHPTDDWDQQQRELSQVYEALAGGLAAFLPCLAHWDEMGSAMQKDLLDECENLPKEALSCFEAHYTVLASDCHEFRVWAHRQEYISGQRHLDAGMRQLESTISSLYGLVQHREGEEISTTLRNWYTTQVSNPILRQREIADDLPPGVTLPRKSDAFIPQYFKAVRYEVGTPVGSEEMWSRLPTRDDLPDFLWGYIHSSYSEHHPLIILGHPGSGKSLLTEIFAARLAESPFMPIRILLRDINADARIRQQIDEQLATDIDATASWSRLRISLPTNPAVLIFDGYDELLQASGQVFANYIVDVQQFQLDEKDRSRSGIRAIITSRSVLIEKARIPRGTTVLRLLPFDQGQRNKWIDTWNSVNSGGLAEQGLEPFEIPSNQAVLDLAEQPLLLLMLAIYDSYGNALRQQKDFGRVSLYSQLVSLFIYRECNKDQAFRDLSGDQQALIVANQRRRLGICALGMFNREKLSITHQELDEDLVQFGLSPAEPIDGHRLREADSLIGGFFFIHRSRVTQSDGTNVDRAQLAYEFLHNTFGEYLCAEFLVRRVFELIAEVTTMKQNPRLAAYTERLLNDPGLLAHDWYGCWIATPLSTRPVIVEMIREIAEAESNSHKANSGLFEGLIEFDKLIHNHFYCIFNGHAIPTAILNFQPSSRAPLSIISRIAVYSLNLVIITCALQPKGYVIAYDHLAKYLGKQDPWDRIANLWLSALPDGGKWSISGLLDIKRTEESIHLRLRQPFDTSIAGNPPKAFEELGFLITDEIRTETERTFQLVFASVTHQLGNHVAGMRLFTESLVATDLRNDGKLRKLDAELQRTIEFIESLRDLRDLISNRGIETDRPSKPLDEVIQNLVDMSQARSEEAGVRLKVTYPKNPSIVVDGSLLLQALVNVVDNALQASSKGGSIQIQADLEEEGRIAILVKDQGVGINESHLSRLTEAGYSTKEGGMGFGLFVTRKIIDALGGRLEITSGFKEGTTVRIVLPMKTAQCGERSV